MADDLTSLEAFIKSNQASVFQNVVNILSSESRSACGENENFVGQVIKVRYHLEMKSGERKYVSVIVKKEPSNDQPFTQMYHDLRIFDAEIEMYEKVLHNMGIMLNECGNKELTIWPNYFGHTEKDILLQDLSELGYSSYPKAQALRLDEGLVVMQALGQFHGLSLSLVQRSLYDPSKMPPNIFVRSVPTLLEVNKEACNILADTIKADWDPEWHTFVDKLKTFGEEVGEKSNKLWYETKGNFDVINHGDCWLNNILFKWDKKDTLEHIKFVDFQACHYNCYSWDLTCILFSALLPSIREPNIDLLLTTYLDSLIKYSNATNYNGRYPTLNEIKEEMDKISVCGLIRSIISYSLFLNPDAMFTTATPSTDNKEEEEFAFKPRLFHNKFAKENLQQTLIYFHRKNII